MDRIFKSSADAVAGELRRLGLKIRHRHRQRLALNSALPKATFDEADMELASLAIPTGHQDAAIHEDVAELGRLAEAETELCLSARAASGDLALYRLAARAGLDDPAFDLMLLVIAPEIDEGFGRAFLHMRHSGSGRRTVSVGVAARLLTPDDPGGGRIRAMVGKWAPLSRLGLVELLDSEGGAHHSISLRTLIVAPTPLVLAVLDRPIVDEVIASWVRAAGPALDRDKLALDGQLVQRCKELLARPNTVIVLEGESGVGKRSLIRTVANELGRSLVEASVYDAPEHLSAAERHAIVRLAWLLDACLLLRLAPHASAQSPSHELPLMRVFEVIDQASGTVVVTKPPGAPASDLLGSQAMRSAVTVRVPLPSVPARARLWAETLGEQVGKLDASVLAASYLISGGEIVQAAATARRRASGRADGAACELGDIVDAIDARYATRLQKAGRRLSASGLSLSEIVLAPETKETLRELQDTIRLRHEVLDKQRFGRLVRSRGVSAIFYGEPGTGKTLTASSIAGACGLALYQIDTSMLVSKWIGETEKNLEEVFSAAEAGHALLLFDEADAIFGKRTDVKSSNDRHANMQTNFLLSRIETFNGIAILTTNRDSAIDAALMRRLSFRVYFPMPEVDERVALWRTCLEGQPIDHIDLVALAEALEMSGGYIRNAVVRGAYLAASMHRPLTTELLLKASKLVLRDAGKVI